MNEAEMSRVKRTRATGDEQAPDPASMFDHAERARRSPLSPQNAREDSRPISARISTLRGDWLP